MRVRVFAGAAGVIGSKTATYLAKFKPRLVLAGRNSTGLEHTYRACKERGLKRDEVSVTGVGHVVSLGVECA